MGAAEIAGGVPRTGHASRGTDPAVPAATLATGGNAARDRADGVGLARPDVLAGEVVLELLHLLGRRDAAIHLRRDGHDALAIRPADSESLVGIGNVLLKQERYADSADFSRLRAKPVEEVKA